MTAEDALRKRDQFRALEACPGWNDLALPLIEKKKEDWEGIALNPLKTPKERKQAVERRAALVEVLNDLRSIRQNVESIAGKIRETGTPLDPLAEEPATNSKEPLP